MGLEDFLKDILGGGTEPQREKRPGPRPAPKPTDEGGGIMQSVVQITALRKGFMGGMSSAWTGSGTIVHPSGIILTNCHVADPRAMGMSSPPADRLGIGITERSDEPPAISYFAKVIARDPRLDLAVLRIIADVRGQALDNLNLPAVDIGDSDALELGDRLAIFGYPGIGGETVTFTSGNVSGFTDEKGVRGNRAWIKTDATIAGGNSGGTAVNAAGQLVGIPTQAAAGTGVTPVDARPVVDTNRDGRIDERDTPMAVGGFINGLRPVSLAIPLLEQAGMNVEVEGGQIRRGNSVFPDQSFQPSVNPEFRELLFSTRVTDDGRPIHPTSHIPTGGDTIYATFEYSGMQPGMAWSVIWTSGGHQIIDQQDVWDEGPTGRKAVKVSNSSGLPQGEYHLILGIGGAVALEGQVVVGNPVDESDSEVSGRLVDADTGRPVDGGIVIVLKPQAALQEFLQTQNRGHVQTQGESSANGTFTLADQLPKGQAYSLIVLAQGYQPVIVEGALRLSDAAPENASIGNIEMNAE